MSSGKGNDADVASAGLVSTPTWVTVSKFSLTYAQVGKSGCRTRLTAGQQAFEEVTTHFSPAAWSSVTQRVKVPGVRRPMNTSR